MLVAGLVVVVSLEPWLVRFLFLENFEVLFWGGQKSTTGLPMLFLGG